MTGRERGGEERRQEDGQGVGDIERMMYYWITYLAWW